MPSTKIVATLGPASSSPEILRQLIRAGMNVARLNFSHGDPEFFRGLVSDIHAAAEAEGRSVCILQDLSGPKVRIGMFAAGQVFLKPGDEFTLTTRKVPGDEQSVTVPLPDLTRLAAGTERLLLSDGLIELRRRSVEGEDVLTEVVVGGWLGSRKGISFPGQPLTLDAITPKDMVDLKLGIELNVDYVALSFVRSHHDVRKLRGMLREGGSRARVCAKLERPEALDDLEAICSASDAVMVARGDLAIELAPEKVPIAQKRIIREARRHNIHVITATQMLESMIHNPWPTRAEASDVANAVLDGTDAVMLSGETATGDYPVRVVEMMQRIITEAEVAGMEYRERRRDRGLHFGSAAGSISWAASELAEMVSARAICAFTNSGSTARLISKTHPAVPIIGLSPNPQVLRQLCLARGVTPVRAQEADGLDMMVREVERVVLEQGIAEPGDNILITAGYPFGPPWRTNLLKVHRVGDYTMAVGPEEQ